MSATQLAEVLVVNGTKALKIKIMESGGACCVKKRGMICNLWCLQTSDTCICMGIYSNYDEKQYLYKMPYIEPVSTGKYEVYLL